MTRVIKVKMNVVVLSLVLSPDLSRNLKTIVPNTKMMSVRLLTT